MAQTVTGVGIFFGALGDVFRNLPIVARIIALPMALYLALEVPLTRSDIALYEQFYDGVGGAWIIRFVAFILLIGMVCVTWHRFRLLGEVPRSIIPSLHFRLWWRYALAWLVLGIIVGLTVLLLVGAPIFIIMGLVAPDLWSRILDFGYATDGFLDFADPLVTTLTLVGVSAILFVGIYLTYRIQVGLPAIAIDKSDGFNMRQSWRETAPLAVPLLLASVFGAMGQGVLVFAPEFFLYNDPAWSDPSIPYSFSYMYFDNVVLALTDMVLAIFGAAILARIYEAVQLADDPVAVF